MEDFIAVLKLAHISLSNCMLLHFKFSFIFSSCSCRPPSTCQKDVPILVLDCEEEFEDNPERQKQLLKEVEQYLQKLETTTCT